MNVNIGLMRGEELPEERMLSLSKSWFSRSVSNGAINECSSDGIPDTALPREGGLEDRDVWGGFSTLRQLSMRYPYINVSHLLTSSGSSWTSFSTVSDGFLISGAKVRGRGLSI